MYLLIHYHVADTCLKQSSATIDVSLSDDVGGESAIIYKVLPSNGSLLIVSRRSIKLILNDAKPLFIDVTF